ncbi:MAG: hypothetical protein RQ751_13535, partial [Longimicrobiales bacterium]|nr:hypothetical protein [Longimicrobiales bacterium]
MTQRIFLPWTRPLLPQAARRLVEHYASGPTPGPGTPPGPGGPHVRMEGAVVVVPGARAGRRLKELLLEAAEERGVGLVPPRVVTLGALPELLYVPGPPAASAAVRRLAWVAAFRVSAATPGARARLERVFAAIPVGEVAAWLPLAREGARLARTVAAAGLRFRDVAARCAASPLYDDAARWRVLAEVQARYEARLTALGYRDPDLGRMAALESGAVRLPGDVWLVGVAELPGVVRRMLAAAADAGGGGSVRALVHGPEGGEALFDALGCVQPEVWETWELPVRDEEIRVVDGPADQAEAVAAILGELGGRWAPDEIALGVPAPEVVPALADRLPRGGVAVRDAAGRALAATGPCRLLAAAAEYLPERRYDAAAALLRHPDLAPALEAEGGLDGDWITRVDLWYARHLPERVPEPVPNWVPERVPGPVPERGAGRSSREEADVAPVLGRLAALLAPLTGPPRALPEWVEPILAFLRDVYRHHGLSEARERDRQLVRALTALRWAVEPLARIPVALDVRCDAATALRLILEEAASVRLPPPPRDDAVEMLGWLELHLDDSAVTVVTGVNEGALPESVRGDPFLPDSLRRLLGIEDNRQRHARDVYRLAAMYHSRAVLRLVAGRRSAEGDPLRPSRLLFATDEEAVVRRVRHFFGAPEPDPVPGVAPALPAALRPTPPASAFLLPPEGSLRLDPFPDTIGVTDFARILADPYAWVLARLRGLQVVEDAQLEMDGAVFGSLAHQVLQGFGERERRRHEEGTVLTDPEAVWRELERALEGSV